MSEKVKVSKEVAKAIETVNTRWTRSEIVEYHANGKGKWDISYLNTLELDTLITALYIGYEVESTPEDKIKVYYADLKLGRDRTDLPLETWRGKEYSGRIDTLLTVLSLLNIKIEGVNA